MPLILGPNNEMMSASLAPSSSLTALALRTTVPATSAATGIAGETAFDASNFYICVAANTWRKVTIAAF